MTPERFEQICEVLDEMTVILSLDPLQDGPHGLAEKVAQTRRHLSNAEQYHREVMRGKHRTQIAINGLSAEIAVSTHGLLMQPSIQRLSSIKDRQAAVSVRLEDEHAQLTQLELVMVNLKAAEDVIKSKLQDLKGTATDLRTQRNLLRDAEAYGSGYGSEAEPDLSLPPGPLEMKAEAPPIDMSVLDDTPTPDTALDVFEEDPAPKVTTPYDHLIEDLKADNKKADTKKVEEPAPTDEKTTTDYDDLVSSPAPETATTDIEETSADEDVLALLNEIDTATVTPNDIPAQAEINIDDLLG